MQSSSWYVTPSGTVGRRFTKTLAAEWQDIIDTSWNSERPLLFTHDIFTKMLGICMAREIRAQIIKRIDLWDRGLHAGLVEDSEEEGTSRDVRATR